jgi:hypothetical protein
MNVANLQTLLRNQAAFLADAGAAAKLVADFDSVAQGLEPFAAMKLDDLFGLLRQADEYRSTGILPVKVGKPKAAKPSAAAAIEAATQTLRQLYDQTIDPGFSFEAVDAALKSLGKLTVPQLKEVARATDIANVPTKKADIVAALGQKIKDRREMHQRAMVHGETSS